MNSYSSNLKVDNLAMMKKRFLEDETSLILLERVPQKDVHKYGIAKLKKSLDSYDSVSKVEDIIEKPSLNFAPSGVCNCRKIYL